MEYKIIFATYATVHFITFVWALWAGFRFNAPGAWITAMIAGGLVYDNSIISLGASIGLGPTLEALSWPRFAMHSLLTPFMMIAVTQMAVAGGIQWASSKAWKIAVWLLVIGGIVEGSYAHLIFLDLEPTCFADIVRYTGNVKPDQFCLEGQQVGAPSGPPIPSIVGNFVTLVMGIALFRVHRWAWLMVGSLVMFVAAGFPMSGFGLAPGNGGEVILLLTYAATMTRFQRGPARGGRRGSRYSLSTIRRLPEIKRARTMGRSDTGEVLPGPGANPVLLSQA